MSKRKTTQQFIQDAWCRHGDIYNYSLVDYINTKTKVKIICHFHGVFEQRPNNHLQGQHCKKCSDKNNNKDKVLTKQEFIHRSNQIHQDKYDYSLVDYINTRTKVNIICPLHGEFKQTPNSHLRGKGCKKCYYLDKRITTEQFIQKSKQVHQDKYDYSLVDYINTKTKVKILCPVHAQFEQTPAGHLRGQGCKKCSIQKQIVGNLDIFIHQSNQIHSFKYDYSLVNYINNNTKVKIICPVHAQFEQTPARHLKNMGCPKCTTQHTSDILRKSPYQFIHDTYYIHKDKYDYSLVDYVNAHTKVKIICPLHDEFEQTPDSHLRGSGCPKCTSNISKQEQEVQDWLKEYISIETNDRKLIKPYELDIVIPDKKICIEYNGLYWHSETQGKDRKYHLNKYNLCKDKGYRLIQIWENEWLYKQDIVKSIILNAIGINKRVIHGRKCRIQNVSVQDARIMYDDNHIQGFKGGLHKGLYFDDELVSLMTIDSRNELQRFVNLKYTKIHGSFSKLLKSFIKDGCENIYTFADTRYFTGDVYTNNGFKYVHTTKPNYYYIKKLDVYHRMSFQKKNIKKKYNQGVLTCFDINKTEYQNMLNNGYARIWDNGNIKFIL